jgi:hypothetical protein
MKAASINNLKKELAELSHKDLLEACLKIVKFKKENKELLTFLLFEAHDISSFVEKAKIEIDNAFDESNLSHPHYAKKSIRKVLVLTNKFIKYSSSNVVQSDLLIYFCQSLKQRVNYINRNPVIFNMYNNQLKKIDKAVASMHEDLQFDYKSIVADL